MTIVLGLVVLGAIGHWHLEGQFGGSWGSSSSGVRLDHYGWPVNCVLQATVAKPAPPKVGRFFQWHTPAVVVNIGASLLVMGCALFLLQRMARRPPGPLFGVRSVSLLAFAVTLVVAWTRIEYPLWAWWIESVRPPWMFPLYTGTVNRSLPLLMGVHIAVGCCAYVLGLSVLSLLTRLGRWTNLIAVASEPPA